MLPTARSGRNSRTLRAQRQATAILAAHSSPPHVRGLAPPYGRNAFGRAVLSSSDTPLRAVATHTFACRRRGDPHLRREAMGGRASPEFACSVAKNAALAGAASSAPDGTKDRRPCKSERSCPHAAQRERRKRREQSDRGRARREQLVDRAKPPGDRRVDRAPGRRFRKHGLRWPGRRAARFGGLASDAFPEAADSRPQTTAASRAAPTPSAPSAATSQTAASATPATS